MPAPWRVRTIPGHRPDKGCQIRELSLSRTLQAGKAFRQAQQDNRPAWPSACQVHGSFHVIPDGLQITLQCSSPGRALVQQGVDSLLLTLIVEAGSPSAVQASAGSSRQPDNVRLCLNNRGPRPAHLC